MTIQVQGHVASMTTGAKGRIRLTITLAADRSESPVIVEATKEELGGLYLPGTSVLLTIRPV